VSFFGLSNSLTAGVQEVAFVVSEFSDHPRVGSDRIHNEVDTCIVLRHSECPFALLLFTDNSLHLSGSLRVNHA
jgi:hypothetical protein